MQEERGKKEEEKESSRRSSSRLGTIERDPLWWRNRNKKDKGGEEKERALFLVRGLLLQIFIQLCFLHILIQGCLFTSTLVTNLPPLPLSPPPLPPFPLFLCSSSSSSSSSLSSSSSQPLQCPSHRLFQHGVHLLIVYLGRRASLYVFEAVLVGLLGIGEGRLKRLETGSVLGDLKMGGGREEGRKGGRERRRSQGKGRGDKVT